MEMVSPSRLKPIAPYIGQIVGYVELQKPVNYQEGDYRGFAQWRAMLIAGNREQKAVEWLRERVHIVVYWPTFTEQVRIRGARHRPRTRGVVPGMAFVPDEILWGVSNLDEVLEYAHVYGFVPDASGRAATLTKADIEKIRNIEAKLNLPEPPPGSMQSFIMGQNVRFKNELYAAFWGEGIVFEVASESRIGVEVKKLFGRTTRVYVPASEIEAM